MLVILAFCVFSSDFFDPSIWVKEEINELTQMNIFLANTFYSDALFVFACFFGVACLLSFLVRRWFFFRCLERSNCSYPKTSLEKLFEGYAGPRALGSLGEQFLLRHC